MLRRSIAQKNSKLRGWSWADCTLQAMNAWRR
jgi:hypothetical protein